MPPLDAAGPGVRLRLVASLPGSFATHVAVPPGDDSRVFVADRLGRVWVVRDGRVGEEPLVDLSGEIAPTVSATSNERGLFSIAFAPDYRRSGRFYLSYSDALGDHRVTEFRRLRGPHTGRLARQNVLVVPHSFAALHYGGHLAFGPDGALYVSTGDATRPADAQRRRTPYGKLLRLDISRRRPPDVVAMGLRNPYRFSFDGRSGAMIVGDVGENAFEEIDVVALGRPGVVDFGWPRFEGVLRRTGAASRAHTAPRIALDHGTAHAIVGGLVVRGRALPKLLGRYVFADFCDGRISVANLTRRRWRWLGLSLPQPTSLAADSRGRVYATSLTGRLYQLVETRAASRARNPREGAGP